MGAVCGEDATFLGGTVAPRDDPEGCPARRVIPPVQPVDYVGPLIGVETVKPRGELGVDEYRGEVALDLLDDADEVDSATQIVQK